jgi:hypothetical protein
MGAHCARGASAPGPCPRDVKTGLAEHPGTPPRGAATPSGTSPRSPRVRARCASRPGIAGNSVVVPRAAPSGPNASRPRFGPSRLRRTDDRARCSRCTHRWCALRGEVERRVTAAWSALAAGALQDVDGGLRHSRAASARTASSTWSGSSRTSRADCVHSQALDDDECDGALRCACRLELAEAQGAVTVTAGACLLSRPSLPRA